MQLLRPNAYFDIDNLLKGEKVLKTEKRLNSLRNIYENSADKLDELMYEVYIYSNNQENNSYSLSVGLTILYPVLVNGECNMTRGHFHKNTEHSEIYYGIQGEGLLMFMDELDNIWCESVFKGSIHYIDGKFAHRLINTSSNIFKVAAIWSESAGHDYERLEKNPFKSRVFNLNGKIIFKEET